MHCIPLYRPAYPLGMALKGFSTTWDGFWVAASANKEDIWVYRVPYASW